MPRKTPRPLNLPVYLGAGETREQRKAKLEAIAREVVNIEGQDKSGVSKMLQELADGKLEIVRVERAS